MFSKPLGLVLLCLIWNSGASAATLRTPPPVEEPANAVLRNNTFSGQSEAMAFIATHEPKLLVALQNLSFSELRRRFNEPIHWFQRVGNYRKRQKREALEFMGKELGVPVLAYDLDALLIKQGPPPRRKKPASWLQASAPVGDSKPRREKLAGQGLGTLDSRFEGTEIVVGEVPALAFLDANEPALATALRAMPRQEMRKRFAASFYWFKRVGNYRTRQKRSAIEQMGRTLDIPVLDYSDLLHRLRKQPPPNQG